MSPVQRTIALLVLLAVSIFIAVFFTACSDRIKTDLNVYKALDESLANSNAVIQRGSEQIYYSLEDKLSVPATSEKAKIWQPRAMLIKALSSDMMIYIEGLKTDLKKEAGVKSERGLESFREADKNAVIRLFDKKGKGNELYEKLQKYKSGMLTIDSQLTHTFDKTLLITTGSFESSENKQQNFIKTFFDDIPAIAALAMLSKFQNNIKIIENRTIEYCHNQTNTVVLDCGHSMYAALAVINSSYVKAGEKVEIIAAVGSFNRSAKPVVTINNRNIPLDVDGASHYKFSASDKPGKHIVPVKISFIDEDGKAQTITKNIEYTVAKETEINN